MAKLEGCLKPRICNFRLSFSDRFIPYCKSPETGCHNGNPTVTSIDSPPSTHPADFTRALAKAFRMYAKGYRLTAMLVHYGLIQNEKLDEAGYPILTDLGRATWSIAEGE